MIRHLEGLASKCVFPWIRPFLFAAICLSTAAQAPAPEPFLITGTTANTISLAWNDIYEDEDGFRIERFDPAFGSMVTIATLGPNMTNFLDTGLIPGQSYSYEVLAFSAEGDSQRAFTLGQATPIPAPVPLLITATTANTISLSWNDLYDNEDGFRIERFDPALGTMVVIAFLGPNITDFTDTGLTPGNLYTYEAVAFSSGGDSYRASTFGQATPIPAPAPLLITATTANTISLSWSDLYNNEDGFRIERFDPALGAMVAIAFLGPNITDFTDTGLTPGNLYTYEVVAFNSGGDSYSASTFGQATPIPAPGPLLVLSSTANTVALGWSDTYSDEDGFRVKRFDPVSSTMVTIAILGPDITEFLDTGLTPGVSYTYEVVAFNSGGESYAASTTAQPMPVPSPGPLVITSVTANTIGLAWSDIYSNEDGFYVRRYDPSTEAMVTIATLASNVTTFRDSGLIAGTSYYYEVVAYNSGGESYPADAMAQPTPVPAPDPLVKMFSSANTIGLSWNDIYGDEDGFRLERSEDGIAYGVVAQLSANQTNYVDTGLEPEQFYFYRVAAFNSGGDSYYSATLSAGATPVPAPDPLAVTTVTATQIGLSWNDIYSDEDGFRLERSTDSISFGVVATLPANTTNFADANLLPNTFYAYRVAGFNAGGDSYYSMTVNATTLPLPPFTPSNLSATAVSQTGIQLSWTDAANNETSFAVERSVDGTTFIEIGVLPANATAFADTTVSPNGTFYYRVRAFNAGGGSPWSNTASASTPDYPPVPPSNLISTAASTNAINLSWTDHSSNETGFQIERSTDGVNFSLIATVGPNVIAYSNTGLTPSTAYSYRVRAANSGGTSAYSNVASATTLAATPPAAPSNLVLTVVSSSRIDLAWQDNASNETQYFVEMAVNSGAFTQIAQLSANTQSWSATGLTRNTRYSFRVRCSNNAGFSGYSNAPNAKTLK